MGGAAKSDRQTGSDQGSAGSAARSLDILEFLSKRTYPTPATVIASACHIPRSSTYSLLNLLKTRRFVMYHPVSRSWSIGLAASGLSRDAPLFAHGLAVLRAFATDPRPLTARELSRLAQLPYMATVQIIASLVESDLLREESDGTYSLGLEIVSLAAYVGHVDRLRMVCRPHLVRLRDAIHETANLIIRDGNCALYVDQIESKYSLRHSGWMGRRVPLEGTASGAMFVDRSQSHYAVGRYEPGVTAVACAIQVPEEDMGISITGPSWRIEEFGIARARAIVEAVAREISLNFRNNARP